MLSQRGAADAVQKLPAVVQVKATCERDGKPVEIQTEAVVPGDIVLLHAGDSVDPESVTRPRRRNIKFIRRFMIVFGLATSACDYLTFGVLLLLDARQHLAVPHRLVCGECRYSLADRAGHPHPEALLPEPPQHPAAALRATGAAPQLRTPAPHVPVRTRGHHDILRNRRRNG